MKQAVMTSPGVIEFRDVPVPRPGPEEVLIRVRRIGVCGSDIHVRHGRHPFTSYPVVQGHEFSGTIESVGRRVKGLRPGLKVTATPQIVCGRCAPCRRGDHHICDVHRVQGFQAPGCAQEFFLARADQIVPLPASFSFEQGAMVEPAAVGVHTVSRAGAMAGLNVVVTGAGPIGNLVGQVARASGAKVLMTDVSEYRLEIAKMCGLRAVSLAGRESLKDASTRVFGAKGFQKAFECAGAEAAINEAIDAIQKGGTIVAVGVYGDRPRVNMGLVQDREVLCLCGPKPRHPITSTPGSLFSRARRSPSRSAPWWPKRVFRYHDGSGMERTIATGPEFSRGDRDITKKILPLMAGIALVLSGCSRGPAAKRFSSPAEAAARALAGRLLPDRAEGFVFEQIAPEEGRDVFEVESRGDRIVVRGSNAVAMASGLNWYLKTVCRCLVSVRGNQLAVPTLLPPVRDKVRVRTPYKDRYFFNYCTFSYTMAWWDWPRWERMIDWLALNGVNMPLALTGQEAVWVEVLRELGFNTREIGDFLVGPAYLPWGWMGNIDGLGGPLPGTWIRSHAELARKILARERELGMTPVLQGFTGHVPLALKNRYPAARIRQTGDWSAGFSGTYFLDPTDPLFRRIGRLFIEKQTALFGTDHLYAADTFNEMDPPSGSPDFLRSVSVAIFGAMAEADPRAVWVLQGWFLYYSPAKFWTEARSRAFLGAVPDDRMIVLDLFGDQHPIWDKFQAFYGKPWIWNVVHNFGGKTSLNGDLPTMAANLAAAIRSPARGRFAGIGMMMEGFGDNPVVQEFVMDMVWRPDVPPLGPWIRDFARRRYGSEDPAIAEVWDTLLDTVYKTPVQSGSLVRDRPGLYNPERAYRSVPKVPYDPRDLAGACRKFLSLSGRLGSLDTYRLDAVNLTRQVLSNLSNAFVKDVDTAYRSGDLARLRAAGRRLLEMIEDLDALLATREEFLLGRWIADARRWAADDAESGLLEWNARNLITLWGTKCTEGMFDDLNGYAQKQWSGLFSGYDLPRWKAFLETLEACLRSGRPFERAGYVRQMCAWEQAWSRGREIYPAAPRGDPLALATGLLKKYGTDIFGAAVVPAADERKENRHE